MTLRIGFHEANAIVRAAKLLDYCDSSTQKAGTVLDCLFQCESTFAVEQIIAPLPPELRSEVRALCERFHVAGAATYYEAFAHGGYDPAIAFPYVERKLAETVVRLKEIGDRPTLHPHWNAPAMTREQRHWLVMEHAETAHGETCQRAGCDEDRIVRGVLCPAHHYEMVYGEPPPPMPG